MKSSFFWRKILVFVFSFAVFIAAGNILLSVPVEAKTKTSHVKNKKHRVHKSKKQLSKRHHKRRKAYRHAHASVARGNIYSDIVIEARTGRVLHATYADSPRHPASLTKMMTLYLTFQAIEAGRIGLQDRISVSSLAAKQSPTKLGLRAGQTLRVQDAILGLVTVSANDAAVALAEALGGSVSHFADLMTKQAHALGMSQTNFDNPNGLPDPDQVTTAHDMAILAQALLYHYPRFYPYFSQESYVYRGISRHNHNHLMERYAGMDGIKTGYIRASGFNLVASAERHNIRLIGVIFGGRSAPSRDLKMEALLNDAFDVALGHAQPPLQGEGDADEFPPLPVPPKRVIAFRPSDPNPLPASGGDWAIQIGAFGSRMQAMSVLKRLARQNSPLLSRLAVSISPIAAGRGKTLYRARFVGLGERTARSVCAYLGKHGHSCLPVNP